MASQAEDLIRAKLEISRRELLDLSLRNSLLNYRLLRAKGLEVVDEIPEEIFRTLVIEGKTMSFLPGREDDGSDLTSQPEEVEPTEGVASGVASRHSDSRLQTSLTSTELQSRLLNTYRDANTFSIERGINVLFLALGMVNWYESDTSDRVRHAPLIVVPVRLERSDVRDRFHLKHTGDDVGDNLSFIEKVKLDFGLNLPRLPDSEDIDVSSYFDSCAKAVSNISRWTVSPDSIVLGLFSFNKINIYHDLDPDTWPEDSRPADHPILKSLLHEGFRPQPSTIGDEDHLDQHLDPKEVHHVADADSTQILAIHDVKNGRDLVIQGPPGTGKSQTITNIIAEAIGQGKTVLFVSEKMAALEVVKRRLDNLGLGDACLELHSNKTAKTAVLNELKKTWGLGEPRLQLTEDDLDSLASLRDRLNAYCWAVNTQVGISGVTPYQAYGELSLLQRRSGETPLERLDLPVARSWSGSDFRSKEAVVQELQVRIDNLGVPNKHPFWGCQLRVMLPTEQARLLSSMSEAQTSLHALISVSAELAGALNLPLPSDHSETAADRRTAQWVLDSPDLEGISLAMDQWVTNGVNLEALLSAGARLSELKQMHDQVLIPGAWEQDLLETRQALATKGRSTFRVLSGTYRRAKARLTGLCQNSLPSGIDSQIQLADAILESQPLQATIERHDSLGQQIFGSQWAGSNSNWTQLGDVRQWMLDLQEEVEAGRIHRGIAAILANLPPLGDLPRLIDQSGQALTSHLQNLSTVTEVMKLDVQQRFNAGPSLEDIPFPLQQEALGQWSQRISEIHDIVSFNNMIDTCRSEDLEGVLTVAISWSQAGEHLVDAFRQTWYEGILEQAFLERKELASFDGNSHQQVVDRFRESDRVILEHNQARLAHLHWSQLPARDGAGQLGILMREFEKRRRHLPIRELVKQCGNAIQTIKPVFMMSPLSLSTFLSPGSVRFDLIVFDEASQVKPVDAFGAILRGKQAVVVGDDQQMPPSNFFDTLGQSDDDDEGSATADIESILGLFSGQGAPQRMLRWHYRSRHESLIAVSNREFYDNSLMIFPSPDAERSDLGLKYHFIADSVYDRGGSRTNQKEAEAVARAVMDHARNHPDLSLGVAAFSMAQMTAIDDQLELLRRQDPSLEGFFSAHPTEPFFVKNLENVQGDERDVIFISIGYGRTAQGRIFMEFGPLNPQGGHRRLNVLISRAKRRCEVFTNLCADDIDLARTASRGVRALKTFLAYAEKRVMDLPVETEMEVNFFEKAVADELISLGYDVRSQIGSAGYFIDLAVVDSERPGRYLIGIECDGASYHSSRSARDRDRLRQQVLESLGWKIHRIWSTDWFRNPKREVERTVEAIEKAKTFVPTQARSPDTRAPVAREEPTCPDSSSDNISMYQVANFALDTRGDDLHLVSAPSLAAWIKAVVDIESPVHASEAARRVANLAGVRRIGGRIQDAFDYAIQYAVRAGAIRQQGEFLWSSAMEKAIVRDRSSIPAASRRLELVSQEEIGEAIEQVVASSYGIQRDDVPPNAGRLLGFARITEDMRAMFSEVVDYMILENRLLNQDNHLVATSQ